MFISRNFLLAMAVAICFSDHSFVAAGKLNAVGTAIFLPAPAPTAGDATPTNTIPEQELPGGQSIHDKIEHIHRATMTAAPKVLTWVA
jgi:hypothetical protein